MSNFTIERQLDLVITLLESLPQRMCDEIENRKEIINALYLKQLQDEVEVCFNNMKELNELMYSTKEN